MKRWVMLLAVVVLCVPAMRADDASKRAKVEQLFTVMRMEQLMEQQDASVLNTTRSAMHAIPGFDQMTPSQRSVVDVFDRKLSLLIVENLGWKALEEKMVSLYVGTYTEEEIDSVLSFYQSPAGQAWLSKTPEITAKRLQIFQQNTDEIQPKLQKLIADFARQFVAAGQSAGPHATVVPSKAESER